MERKIITAATYAAALKETAALIRGREIDLDIRHILIVPDKYTLACERLLHEGTAGAFDVEVTTFNRLFTRISGKSDYLSREGAIMLLRSLLFRMQSRLGCFKRSAAFKGFAARIYDTIAQLKSCRVTPEMLTGEGALGRKLADIRAIYEAYESATAGRFVDAGGRMELLCRAIEEGDALADAHVYVADFDAFTPQLARVVSAIERRALSLTVAEAGGEKPRIEAEVEAYAAPDPVSELKAAAVRIRDYVYRGGRYGDVCIVTSEADYELAKRIFAEFDIPFYIDVKAQLSAHPLSLFLSDLYEAARRRCRRAQMLALAKNFYAGATKPDADAFDNFCRRRAVDYLGFYEPFTERDPFLAEECAAAERVRVRLIRYVEAFSSALSAAKDAAGFCRAVEELLALIGADELTEALNESAPFALDAPGRIRGVLDLMRGVFSGPAPVELLAETFFEGLESVSVSRIPNLSDTVQIGPPEAFRGMRFDYGLIFSFNEGVLPLVAEDCGVITDAEIDLMSGAANIEPKIEDVNRRRRDELFCLMASCKRLFLSAVTGEGGRPSAVMLAAVRGAKEPKIGSYEEERLRLPVLTDREEIGRVCASRGNALELIIKNMSASKKGAERTLPWAASVYDAVGPRTADRYLAERTDPVSLDEPDKLFFVSGSTTVSQLQTYFNCPYQHFLKYGLKLKEREEGNLSPIDIGNFLHRVIEIFVAEGAFDDAERRVKSIVDKTADESVKYRLDANKAVMRRIEAEAVTIAAVIARQIEGGSFVSLGQEIHFGGERDALKSVTFRAGEKRVRLRGIMDRVDVWEGYARLVDYKTGRARFAFDDLYYGLKIQLTLYMQVLIENGYRPAGLFYFPFNSNWSDDAYSHRLNGLYDSDPGVVFALDNKLREGGASEIIEAKTGTTKLRAEVGLTGLNPHAFSGEKLMEMCRYSYDVAAAGAEEILAGYIAPAPCRAGSFAPCNFCAYRAVCAFDSRQGRFRRLKKADASDITALYEGGNHA